MTDNNINDTSTMTKDELLAYNATLSARLDQLEKEKAELEKEKKAPPKRKTPEEPKPGGLLIARTFNAANTFIAEQDALVADPLAATAQNTPDKVNLVKAKQRANLDILVPETRDAYPVRRNLARFMDLFLADNDTMPDALVDTLRELWEEVADERALIVSKVERMGKERVKRRRRSSTKGKKRKGKRADSDDDVEDEQSEVKRGKTEVLHMQEIQ